jgi:hypothetical protein
MLNCDLEPIWAPNQKSIGIWYMSEANGIWNELNLAHISKMKWMRKWIWEWSELTLSLITKTARNDIKILFYNEKAMENSFHQLSWTTCELKIFRRRTITIAHVKCIQNDKMTKPSTIKPEFSKNNGRNGRELRESKTWDRSLGTIISWFCLFIRQTEHIRCMSRTSQKELPNTNKEQENWVRTLEETFSRDVIKWTNDRSKHAWECKQTKNLFYY